MYDTMIVRLSKLIAKWKKYMIFKHNKDVKSWINAKYIEFELTYFVSIIYLLGEELLRIIYKY